MELLNIISIFVAEIYKTYFFQSLEQLDFMKKLINVTMLLTALLIVAACGSKDAKKADSADSEKKENAKSEEFTGEKYSKDAAIYYFDKTYGIDFKELEPDFKYDESGKYTFKGDKSEVSARFIDPEGRYTPEQIEGFVRKIYAATAKASEGGKNVYGFLLSGKDTKEGAMEEKSIDEVLKGGYTEILGVNAYTGGYSWAILKDGEFYDVSVSALERKAEPNEDRKPFEYVGRGYGVSINKGMQKSLDDTMNDAEEAFKKIENDPEMKKKIQKEAEKVKKQYGL